MSAQGSYVRLDDAADLPSAVMMLLLLLWQFLEFLVNLWGKTFAKNTFQNQKHKSETDLLLTTKDVHQQSSKVGAQTRLVVSRKSLGAKRSMVTKLKWGTESMELYQEEWSLCLTSHQMYIIIQYSSYERVLVLMVSPALPLFLFGTPTFWHPFWIFFNLWGMSPIVSNMTNYA